ncbi:unnamed protein product [Kuraishia capsulata CBS 1993]|uniref:Dihydroxyacetone synthase n=1 Tax=Kuraishia capsulata CBS 1993 TaxID=1382522 RepID=W6MPR5_9ASCO|nr:uncharacterized protein KUCA_T00004310001 [Kuraishia capsulata CBS 1993]CDK28328.1 unnamed protein product [Kuraishia capsulata CBS 1993]
MTVTKAEEHDLVLRTFRVLIADLVQHYGGGHPGGAMGMAAIGIALWKYTMRYSPRDPNYFNRDRFVLSNGHACLFQYTFLHLVGYEHMTMDQLKSYHSNELESFCPGHPEIEHPGIEVTTGPLGQGIANSVGMAIAAKNLAATYNRPGFDVVDSRIYCMIGDACLQEGVALEAISLAGHLGLGNLTVLYDNNQITCDGSVDITNTEDINAKFRACNWDVLEIEDGCNDVDGIVAAIHEAKTTSKPTLINIHTIIGIGADIQGTAAAHGAAFGTSSVEKLKEHFGFDPKEYFVVSPQVYRFFGDAVIRGEKLQRDWSDLVESYNAAYPELGADFARRVKGELPSDWKKYIPLEFPSTPTATRKSSGLVANPLAQHINSFMVGTADLTPSVNMAYKDKVDFQNPEVRVSCGANGDYSGRYIHYGIREHAMCAISNGLAAYNKGTFIPITSTFFMFYLYAAPAVRMGALQELQVIHVGTHDSIGTGEDGPTHQPIALTNFYRALPNLLYLRPCDTEEAAGSWECAIEAKSTSSIISCSRQNLPQFVGLTDRNKVKLGAYTLYGPDDADLQILGTGAELGFGLEAAKLLEQRGIRVRVISFPCVELFERQSKEYKASILRRGKVPTIIVEAYAVNGWERYATAGFSMSSFGKSLPGKDAYNFFGFTGEKIAHKIEKYYKSFQEDHDSLWTFQDLN